MAKFNIEVELDWMEEDSYSIDEELKERIIEGVEDALLKKATHEALKMVDAKIAEKVKEAEGTINKAINKFIKMYVPKRLIIFRFLKNQVVGVIRSHIIHCLNMWGCNLKDSLMKKDMIKMENTKIGAIIVIQQQSYLQQIILKKSLIPRFEK